MITHTTVIVLTSIPCMALAAPRPLDALLEAIRHVESGGDDRAVGDNGASRGCLQIGKLYWQDAMEYGGLKWDYKTGSFNRKKSEQAARLYWKRYAPKGASDEDRARIHNGGPKGHLKKATVKYWKKVKKQLSKGKK